jgi:hypothetical protein
MRRDFPVDPQDVDYLDAKGYKWEAVNDRSNLWILIHDFPIPEGYNVRSATAAIHIPSLDYLRMGLDMVYFYPSLHRLDGVRIPATEATMDITGLSYQRWSRHRTAEAPWEVGNDSLITHLLLVENWLKREFKRGGVLQ